MSLRASTGRGRYAASENDVYIGDLSVLRGGVRGVVYCHGSGGSATTSWDYDQIGEMHLLQAVAAQFPVASIDAAGEAWGNPTSTARVDDAITYGQGTLGWKSGGVILIGTSMGALTALNYAKAHPTKVAAVVGVIPAVDLNDLWANNRAGVATALINTAYGGTYSEAVNGPTSNPSNYAAALTTPIQLWYSSNDTTVVPATVTAFDAAVASCTAASVGALGHTQAAIDAAPRDAILAFLSQYA